MYRITFLGIVFAAASSAHAGVTVFVDTTIGSTHQEAQEAAFLAVATGAVKVDFDNVATGPVSGTEWFSSKLFFAQPGTGGLTTTTADIFQTPHSLPNGLWPASGEEIGIALFPPASSVGFWLIDSERQTGTDTIDFFDCLDTLIVSVPMPITGFSTNGPEGNFFIGIVSTEPICSVLVHEGTTDNEGVGVDDFWVESISLPGISAFIDPNVGVALQEAQESGFLAAASSSVVIDFDEVPTGPVTGSEWSSLGAVFSQPGDLGLQTQTVGIHLTPRSLPNALFSTGYEVDETILCTLAPPAASIGVWLTDSEVYIVGDSLDFYNCSDDLIASLPMPATGVSTGTTDGNFFLGLVSDEPICRLVVDEGPSDNENVGLDDLWINSCVNTAANSDVRNFAYNLGGTSLGSSQDCDSNGIPDECETDTDGDLVIDPCDNCPDDPNQNQEDCDGDELGDVCDDDIDGDGIANDSDVCDFTPVDGHKDVLRDATHPLYGSLPCDFNGDCDCDLADWAMFSSMMTSPSCVDGRKISDSICR